MKRLNYVLMLLIVIMFGCKKVIEVDLNEAAPNIVIEGNLSGTEGWAEVKITKTTSYFTEEQAQKVEYAFVTIEDAFDNIFILSEKEAGVYVIEEAEFVFGRQYKLSVEIDGIIYEAKSELNPPVKIDALNYIYNDGIAFLGTGYNIKVIFTDPRGKANYYRIKNYLNGNRQNYIYDFIVFNDHLVDGVQMEIILNGKVYQPGETVSIELFSLDKNVYRYYVTFHELITANPHSVTPSNPVSNFSSGALGYFSAWTSTTKSVLINGYQ